VRAEDGTGRTTNVSKLLRFAAVDGGQYEGREKPSGVTHIVIQFVGYDGFLQMKSDQYSFTAISSFRNIWAFV
jgi:hypothetical protein